MYMFYLVHRYTLIKKVPGPRVIKDEKLKSKVKFLINSSIAING